MIGGIFVSCFVLDKLAKSRKLKIKNVFDTVLYIAIVGIICARIVYVLFYWQNFSKFWQFFYFWQEGMSIYGGIIGGSVFAYFYIRSQHENIWRWLDMMMISLFPGWALAAFGKYLSGSYTGLVISDYAPFVALAEAMIALLIFVVLSALWRNKIYIEGYVYLIGLVVFAFFRLIFGFIGESVAMWWIFTFEQVFSILVIIGTTITLTQWHKIIRPNLLHRILRKLLVA